jgi:hypothetical protein
MQIVLVEKTVVTTFPAEPDKLPMWEAVTALY